MLYLILYCINFIFMCVVLTFCLISDIKTRKVSNQSLKFFFIFATGLVFIEGMLFFEEVYIYIFIKGLYIALTLILSGFLFSFKIIGGGDGKVITLIFFICPVNDLNSYFFFTFFIFFLIFYFILIIINLCLNFFTMTRFSFKFLFYNIANIKIFQKFYLLSFFRFKNLSTFHKYKEKKTFLKSLNIIFNPKSYTFQLFVQIKPPVIASCFFSYLLLSLLRFLT
ncbi:MAG: prepilin peptidase [Candidatus Thorarchaeota archaeon]